MNYLELFTIAIQALKSNVLRTVLTMLGIVIGISSVILIIALAQGATSSITSTVSSLGSNLLSVSPGSGQRGPVQSGESVTTLTNEDAAAIQTLPDVVAVSGVAQNRFQVVGNGQNTNVTVMGVSYQYPAVQSVDIDLGSFFEKTDEDTLTKVAVLGPEVVTTLFGQGADPIGQIITINKKSFRVIGTTKSKGSAGFFNPDQNVYVPVTTAMKTLIGQNYLGSIQLVTDSADKVNSVSAAVTALLSDRHNITGAKVIDFNIRTSQETQATLNTVTGTLTAMLGGIASISLLVGGIGIMNIMMVTVTERTKEIGLLKSIGAKYKDILVQFLIESIVLTVAGGFVGIILGESLAIIISKLINVPYIFQIQSILLAVGVSTLVGIIFGIYPAQRAAKLSPIDALRYE